MKKIISTILVFAILLSISACGNNSPSNKSGDVRTFTDMAGREITIDGNVSSYAISWVGCADIFAMLDNCQGMVAYPKTSTSYAKFVEINLGHYHDEDVKSINGARVRYFPTICSSSYWEHQQGYKSPLKAVVCDIRNEKTGLRDTWYSMI